MTDWRDATELRESRYDAQEFSSFSYICMMTP